MGDEVSTIGDRLECIRRSRDLTQEELSAASGISVRSISTIERGSNTSPRVSTLVALADALDCEISELVDRRDHMGQDRDGGRVIALRDVLLSPALLPEVDGEDGEPTSIAKLRDLVQKAEGMYRDGQFGELLAMLPNLIRDGRVTRNALGEGAAEPLALSYELAGCLLTQLGRTDLGIVGCERAILVAKEGTDELLWRHLHSGYAWVLLHQGRNRTAVDLLTDMAGRMSPSLDEDDRTLAVWGLMLATAVAPTVAQEKDPDEFLRRSGAAGERIGRRVEFYGTAFSPSSSPMQAGYGYGILRKPGRVFEAARKIRPGDLVGITHAAHLMDVASAHAEANNDRAAEEMFMEARSFSPVWFRQQPVAKRAVTMMRERQRRLTPGVRALASSLRLPD